jgi:intein/homing endonuclease
MDTTKKFVFQGKETELQWFIGFAEGDGCWQANLNRNLNTFNINKKDPKVLYKIRKILGFGIIKQYMKGTPQEYFRFSANSLDATEKLITLFNGNLRLQKSKERFSKYLQVYNERTGSQIPLIVKDNSITLKDSWLAGFIDADGCFSASLPQKDDSQLQGTNEHFSMSQLRLRFTLCKKNEAALMEQLVQLFGGSFSIGGSAKDYYRYELQNKEGIQLIFKYLSEYPLKSDKAIALKRFSKLFQRKYDNRDHTTPKAWARLQRLCAAINCTEELESADIDSLFDA